MSMLTRTTALLVAATALPLGAVELETRVVDGLDRGYASYSSSQLEASHVVEKQTTQTFRDIAALEPSLRRDALRELLGSEMDDDESPEQGAFYNEAELRAPLRALVEDPKVGRAAIHLLALIGDRSDLEFVLAHAPKIIPEDDEAYEYWENRWAYSVATALVNPTSEAAWAFLEGCASGDYGDMWVDAGAIKALLLSDRAKATSILARVATRNEDRRSWIESTIASGKPPPPAALADASLEASAAALAPALDVGRPQQIGAPRFNRGGDKALVDMGFTNGSDYLVYTATYHRDTDGLWHLRGVRETLQALMAEDE